MFYVVQVMWLGMYSYVRVYYADNSHNLPIQSVYTFCTDFNYSHAFRLIRSELFIKFVVFPGKVLTISRNVQYVVYVYHVYTVLYIVSIEYTYTGDMAWHVYSYLALGLPGCHFLNIFA